MRIRKRVRNWRESRRYARTLRQLRSLSTDELRSLGIPASQMEELACKAARI
jgi:uncharacterized protein YjiS (DUF1127 family)